MNRTESALKHTLRFSSLHLATNFRARMARSTPILMGDDGRYWIPATNREAGALNRAGYEIIQ